MCVITLVFLNTCIVFATCILRNYIIVGVTSFNLGCNSVLDDESDKKLPSVFADIRGDSIKGWIEEHTAGAGFCRRSQEVKEVKGGE